METGQTKICTITNDDTGLLDGKLVVKKHVIKIDGGIVPGRLILPYL